MEKLFFVLMLVVFPSGVFAISEYTLKLRKCKSGTKDNYCEFLLNSVFCGLSIIFASSIIKALTGKAYLTFIESLQYLSSNTFRNYLLIDAVILIILLALSILVKHDRWIMICKYTINIWVTIFVLMYCFFSRLPSNRLFVFEYGIAFVISFAIAPLTDGKLPKILGGGYGEDTFSLLPRIKIILPTLVLWTVINLVYIPSELYLSNISEIRLRFTFFFVSCILGGSIIILVVCLLNYMLPETMVRFLGVGLFAVSIAEYLQHMFFNGSIRNLDGTYQQWDKQTVANNVVIWLIIILAIYIAYCVKNEVYKVYAVVSWGISAMLIVTTVFLMATTKQSSSDTLSRKGALELSDKNNVIVFVLDWYDAQYVDKVLTETPDFYDELCDFTYYKDTTSLYGYTWYSVPYLLTGTKWEPGQNIGYVEYAFSQSSFLEDVNKNGYSVGVYTEPGLVTENQSDFILNYNHSPKQNFSIIKNASLAMKTSKYLGMPFLYKNRYFFNTYDYMNLLLDDEGWVTNDDKVFYNSLTVQGLDTNDKAESGAFRFYHLYGAHSPYNMTEDFEDVREENINIDPTMSVSQAKGTMKVVYEYLSQLKNLEIYDDATIIITADHGQNYVFEDNADELLMKADLDRPSSPILFIKMPGDETIDGKITYNHDAVSHELMRQIVMEQLGVQDTHNGDKITDSATRVVTDVDGTNQWKEYIISGNVHDWENWSCEQYKVE